MFLYHISLYQWAASGDILRCVYADDGCFFYHKNINFEEMGGKLKRKEAYYKIYHVVKISVCFHNLSLSFASINELYSSRY